MRKEKLLWILVLNLFVACVSRPTADPKVAPQRQVAAIDETSEKNQDKTSTDIVILDERYFTIHYDKVNRIARYVEYHLSEDNLRAPQVKRKNNFHADSLLKQLGIPPVLPSDFARSGYDRGHLAPSADFAYSAEANQATFSMANMTPQAPGLNRFAWEGLENQVRLWACGEKKLRVIDGPIIEKDLARLPNGELIPNKFFKVIVTEEAPIKAIGFEMTQKSIQKTEYLRDVISVAAIESETGIHFFPDLSEEDRDKLESHSDMTEWKSESCKPPQTDSTTD